MELLDPSVEVSQVAWTSVKLYLEKESIARNQNETPNRLIFSEIPI